MPTPDRAVAIVGIACRYGGAPDALAFWSLIRERRHGFRPIDDSRWHHAPFRPAGRKPNCVSTRQAAWLDDLANFPVRAFDMSPLRAEAMDPQQRLALEASREALIDAGLEARPFDRHRSAVFMGISVSEYSRIMVSGIRARQMGQGEFGDAAPDAEAQTRAIAPIRVYTIPGSQTSMAASVVSQFFDLRGPSIAVDGACASSLVTVAMAVQYLRGLPPHQAGESSPVALAGGAYANVVPDSLVGFSRIGVLATDACRPFDAAADGFLPGEGVGMVVLKRLQDAVRDGDRIYAVVRGTGWRSDGAAEGPMTPHVEGQTAVLRAAFDDAGVDPGTVGYVECHGTGTVTGDQVELTSLEQVLPRREAPYFLGSVKANVGHAISAAGIAGLLRATLAIHHRTVPPQAGFDTWHPNLAHHDERFVMPTEARPWPEEVRRATAQSFGFGGINASIVLEQAPTLEASTASGGSWWFCVSAATPVLLREHGRALAAALSDDLAAAAYTLTVTRKAHEHVLIFRACTRDEVVRGLETADILEREQAAAGEVPPPVRSHLLGESPDWTTLFPPEARRIVSLPAAPLERQRCWVVDHAAPPPRPAADTLLALVAQVIGDLSGVPVGRVQPSQRLDADLGFDSILAAELAVRLSARCGIAPPLQTMCEQPTVERLVSRLSAAMRKPREWIVAPDAADADGLLPPGVVLDLLAWANGLAAPWALTSVRLPRTVRVPDPVRLVASPDGQLLLDARGRVVASAERGEADAPPVLAEVVAAGTIETSRPPSGSLVARTAWHLDPHLVEKTLSLLGPETLLQSVDAIVMRVAPAAGSVDVRLCARPDGRYDVAWSQQGTIVGWMRGLRVRRRVGRARRDPLASIGDLRELEHRLQAARHNPYFALHGGAPGPHVTVEGRAMSSFVRYDYLGLNGHVDVVEAACEAIRRDGTSASASRLVGGERDVHRALERGLADFIGCDDAIAMVGGHATNVTTIGRLVGPGDLILYDAHIHDSVQQGALASRAARRAFPHNDAEALVRILEMVRAGFRRCLIVTEGVFSMHGDICDLPALAAARTRFDALLMVDEAHSLGVLGERGRGVAEHWGLDASSADVWMGTLSKALASCGGYIAGSGRLVRFLKYAAPGFVFSVGMPPSSAAAAHAALGVLQREPWRVARVQERSRFLRARLRALDVPCGGDERVPVVPVPIGASARCMALAAALAERGVEVMPIVHPAVPDGSALLRFFVTCAHEEDDLVAAAAAVAAVLRAPVLA